MLTLSLALTAWAATTLAQDVSSTSSVSEMTPAGTGSDTIAPTSTATLSVSQASPSSTGVDTISPSTSTETSPPAATTAAPDFSETITGILFLNGSGLLTGFDASLICADLDETTYVLGCDTAISSRNTLCATDPFVSITVTAGPTSYNLAYSSARGGASGLLTQSCEFDGRSASATRAVCSDSGYLAAGGRSVELASTIQTYGTGTDTFPPTVTISVTAGGDNVDVSGCPATPTSTQQARTATPATSRMVANDAAPTGVAREVYKVLIPMGAAIVAYGGV